MSTSEGAGQARLREGIEAARQGNRVLARDRLLDAVHRDPDLEQGWWWLYQVVDDQREQMRALENVLRLDPRHVEAQQALIGLRQKRLAARDFSQPDWEVLLPQAPLEADDGIDDPYQCPYCGRPAGTEERHCPHCRGRLYRRVARAPNPAALGTVVLLLGLSLAAGVLELIAPLIALGTREAPANAAAFEPLVEVFGVRLVLGDFLSLSEAAARQLLTILLARTGLLAAAILGLRQRLTLAYYAALLALLADILAGLYLLITGDLGPVGAGFNLALAVIIVVVLSGLADQFAVNVERITVKPDGGARSALDYYRRGQAYQRRGMWALAVAQWRKAVGLAPQTADYYKHLGMGYAQIARFERSLRALEEARRQAPDDADLPEIIRLVERKAERHAMLRR
jgi:tetratricopeptide (TPR) repeat protein